MGFLLVLHACRGAAGCQFPPRGGQPATACRQGNGVQVNYPLECLPGPSRDAMLRGNLKSEFMQHCICPTSEMAWFSFSLTSSGAPLGVMSLGFLHEI